jgi:hypothetical protein
MPYEQAKKLQALSEYLEAIGAADVSELPHGSGRPPVQEEQLYLRSIGMSCFWAYKAGELHDELKTFSTSSSTMAIFSIFDAGFGAPNDLDPRFLEFNRQHHALKRLTKRYFRIELPDYTVTLDSRTVRHFIDYAVVLITGDDIPEVQPVFYQVFAKSLNKADGSNYFWPYIEDGQLVFPDGMSLVSPAAFFLSDTNTSDQPLVPPGHVAVMEMFRNNVNCLAEDQQRWSMKGYYRQQAEKRGLGDTSIETFTGLTDALTRKRKAVEDLDRKLKKSAPDDGSGPSGSGGSAMQT